MTIFFFRGYGEKLVDGANDMNVDDVDMKEMPTKQRLLFVHQSEDQKRLLNKYGNHICLLDATWKTTRYAVPLFFVVVKTNVDFQIVGSFAVQDETGVAIMEALNFFVQWNPEWNPKCFMVDNCEQEINSIEEVFPSCKVLLCDFHREQSWDRWLKTTSNGMRLVRQSVLLSLRKIANAECEEDYERYVKELKSSDIWKSKQNFREWFENTWLTVHEKWVKAYRLGLMEIVVNSNNGIERKNRDFKHEFLKPYKDNSLSGMVTVLVEQFGPETYGRYVESNQRRSSRYQKYNDNLPHWMHDRPKKVVDHLIQKMGFVEDIPHECIAICGAKFLYRRIMVAEHTLYHLGRNQSYQVVNVLIGKGVCYHVNICLQFLKNGQN